MLLTIGRKILRWLPILLLLLFVACGAAQNGGGSATPTPPKAAACTGRTNLNPTPPALPLTTINCPSSGYTIKVVSINPNSIATYRGAMQCGPSIHHTVSSGTFTNDLFSVDCGEWILITAVNTDASGVSGASYYEIPKSLTTPFTFAMSLHNPTTKQVKTVQVSILYQNSSLQITIK